MPNATDGANATGGTSTADEEEDNMVCLGAFWLSDAGVRVSQLRTVLGVCVAGTIDWATVARHKLGDRCLGMGRLVDLGPHQPNTSRRAKKLRKKTGGKRRRDCQNPYGIRYGVLEGMVFSQPSVAVVFEQLGLTGMLDWTLDSHNGCAFTPERCTRIAAWMSRVLPFLNTRMDGAIELADFHQISALRDLFATAARKRLDVIVLA
jgi:hypothetical protein